MSINFRKSAAISRVLRFFRSPFRLAAIIFGLTAVGVGAAVSGAPAALLVPGGLLLLLGTFANLLQYLWERLLLGGEPSPPPEAERDTAPRLRQAEEAVNLLAAWIGRLESDLGVSVGRPADLFRLTEDLRAVELSVATQAERIEQLERGLRAIEKRTDLDERLGRVEESLVRLRRTENLALSQGQDLAEALQLLRADLDSLRAPSRPGEPAMASQLSLLEQRVMALASNVERAVAGAPRSVTLNGG